MSALAATAIPGTTGVTGTLQKLLTGFPLTGMTGYVTLMFLTVFPITGIAGLNLVAVNQPINAFMKLSSVVISVLLMTFLAAYLPVSLQGTWMTVLAGLGPWYIFDVIQMLNYTDFQAHGFKPIVPLPFIPSGGGKNSSWNLTSTFVNLFLATVAGSGQILQAVIPGVISPSVGNWISVGSGSMLGVSALGSLAAVALGPTAAPLAAVAGVPLMGGGGLPPLSEFIDKLAVADGPIQAGGTAVTGADKVFLSVLGFIAATGIALGLARSKRA